MTDPKDVKPSWPTGLKKLLDEHGAKSLIDLLKKKVKPKPESKPCLRLPYKDEEPD